VLLPADGSSWNLTMTNSTPYVSASTATLARGTDYDEIRRAFSWKIPELFNMAEACADRHADGSGRLAIIDMDEQGRVAEHTYDDLAECSSALASALTAEGMQRGDRIGIFLSQSVELPIAHLAAWKCGIISVPLFVLFGEDALAYRLRDSGAKAVITDEAGLVKILKIRKDLPELKLVYTSTSPATDDQRSFWESIEAFRGKPFQRLATSSNDPAIIIYTSGTTGSPKGALHAHRTLLGHLPNVEMVHDFFPQPGDRYWTPADWAWIGGLFDALFPTLYHGVPMVAFRARKFDPLGVMKMMADQGVRNAFFPPTALKLLRQSGVKNSGVRLRTILTGGEALGTEMLTWVKETFGIVPHEVYGQTECNLCIGSNNRLFNTLPGAMGKATPGFDVRIIDELGKELPRGMRGIIAVRQPNPVTMLRYWNNPKATEEKFRNGYLLTGDLGCQDEAGYFWYSSRQDDVITTAGYRVGPAEIEDTILKHPSVAMVGVVGVPDPIRTESIKAWIVLRKDVVASDELASEIRDFVKVRLAAHEYPRLIAFVDDLPLTATGKILRRQLKERG
jgi:acetyl-CoA synthetase